MILAQISDAPVVLDGTEFTNVGGSVVLTMIVMEFIKKWLSTKSVFNRIPIFVYVVIIALSFTFLSSMYLHTLEGNVPTLFYKTIASALAASGFYTWLRQGKCPLHSTTTTPNLLFNTKRTDTEPLSDCCCADVKPVEPAPIEGEKTEEKVEEKVDDKPIELTEAHEAKEETKETVDQLGQPVEPIHEIIVPPVEVKPAEAAKKIRKPRAKTVTKKVTPGTRSKRKTKPKF